MVRKLERQKRALARFRILPYEDWLDSPKAENGPDSYALYVERKSAERAQLMKAVKP